MIIKKKIKARKLTLHINHHSCNEKLGGNIGCKVFAENGHS